MGFLLPHLHCLPGLQPQLWELAQGSTEARNASRSSPGCQETVGPHAYLDLSSAPRRAGGRKEGCPAFWLVPMLCPPALRPGSGGRTDPGGMGAGRHLL